MHNWEYCLEVAGTLLCRLIARLDVHVCMGETKTFEECIKIAHNLDLFLSLGKSALEILTSTSMIAVLSVLSLLVQLVLLVFVLPLTFE